MPFPLLPLLHCTEQLLTRPRGANCADRTFETNIREYETPAHANLHSLVRALNPPLIVENSPDPYGPIPASEDSIAEWYQGSELSQVVDLMKRCLECVSCPSPCSSLAGRMTD